MTLWIKSLQKEAGGLKHLIEGMLGTMEPSDFFKKRLVSKKKTTRLVYKYLWQNTDL